MSSLIRSSTPNSPVIAVCGSEALSEHVPIIDDKQYKDHRQAARHIVVVQWVVAFYFISIRTTQQHTVKQSKTDKRNQTKPNKNIMSKKEFFFFFFFFFFLRNRDCRPHLQTRNQCWRNVLQPVRKHAKRFAFVR